MTYEQGLRLITRAIAMYFFIWVVNDLIALPQEILTLKHELRALAIRSADIPPSLRESTIYFFRLAVVSLGTNVLRTTILLMAGRWFMRCGPSLRRFFGSRELVETAK